MEKNEKFCDILDHGLTRRNFLKTSAFLGGSTLLFSQIQWAIDVLKRAEADGVSPDLRYELNKAENIIYSVCLQCHTDCPNKGKIFNGVLVKIDGSPYSPQSMLPHIDYQSDLKTTAEIDGKLCPKGQAAVQTLYDPYRIRKVLKRKDPRGSNQWETISFNRAVTEIVEGGYLFKNVPGEENRRVPGLKDLFMLRDSKLSKEMAEDSKKVARKQLSLNEFKSKYKSLLKFLIDPDHPDLGPVNNQFVFMAGRIEHGRKEFAKRWMYNGFGSTNWYEHTSICEQSHHIAYEAMTRKYENGKWGKGKTHMKPDALNSRFIVFFGTGAFEANFGPPPMAQKITDGLVSKRLKIAVVDPRFSKTAAKAEKWLPIKPGADGALALAMIRWIIEQERYDRKFIENSNKGAAIADSETCWTSSTWLVKIEKGGVPGRYLRAAEIGIGSESDFVTLSDGKPVAFNPNDGKSNVEGDLHADTEINGIRVKSAFRLLRESAFSRNYEDWAEICGLSVSDIIWLAKEFTSYGKKAVAEFYRGPVQHTNGYYNAQCIITLNLLAGNPDWKGGLSKGGGHWHEDGSKKAQPFNLKKLHQDKITPFGVKLTKEKSKYEDSTLFNGYPAKRLWFPFSSNVYQEILPAAEDKYPYGVKALFLHKGTPALSVPGAGEQIRILMDTEIVPLLFACDIVIGESSMYADYIFPDVTAWERWGTPHVTPDVQTITSKVRQPMVAPIPETVEVYGEKTPISMEAIMLAIAEKLKMPGYGKNGFGDGWDFKRPEDFYLKLVANIASGDKPGDDVPAAGLDEMKLFYKIRRHLPESVFDPGKWEKAVGSALWKKVVYVLNRGGRYEGFEKAYSGEHPAHKFKNLFCLYVEDVAASRHPITGRNFSGIAIYEPTLDASGKEVKDKGYNYQLITFKEIFGGQSRTSSNYWSQLLILPENFVIINSSSALNLGLKDGDMVRVTSVSNPEGSWKLGNGRVRELVGKVKVIEGIRPGVAAISWHYGHWAYGSESVEVDGKVIRGDEMRGKGMCPNVVMRIDDTLKNVCLTDPIGASSSFYDTYVRLEKV
ncbi:MAG: molybdopterin-dependent oxidoreductase [Fidelibacterota bacterium]